MGELGADTMSVGSGPRTEYAPLDEAAFELAEAAWHERYVRTYTAAARHGEPEQAHHEAVGEALAAFLGVYERERMR